MSFLKRKPPVVESLVEQVFTESVEAVDEENHTIRGVKFLGRVSENGREYSDKAMREAAVLYESVEININHPKAGKERHARGMLEGWARPINLRVVAGDGVYGDLRYLGSHPETPVILERIREGFGIGLSHNAEGRMTTKGGRRIVESVKNVRSVDLVTRPATNKNLFESVEQTMTTTVRQLIESNKASFPSRLTRLLEMEDAAPVMDAPVEVAAEADPAEEVAAALEKAAMAVLKKWFAGDIDEAAAIAEIKKIAGMKEEAASGDEGGEGGAAPAAPAAPAEPVAEAILGKVNKSLTSITERLDARDRSDLIASVMTKHGLTSDKLGSDRMSLLESQASEAAMDKLVESWPPYLRGGSHFHTTPLVDLQESEKAKHVPLCKMAGR